MKTALRRSVVPVLAARDAVHFPGLVNTLQVAREPSVRAVRCSLEDDGLVLVLSQRDMAVEEPATEDLHEIGTLSQVVQSVSLPDGSLRVALRGAGRVRVRHFSERDGLFLADVEEMEDVPGDEVLVHALVRSCVADFTRVTELNHDIPAEAIDQVLHLELPGPIADAIAHHLPLKASEKQRILAEIDQGRRLESVLQLLRRELHVLEMRARVDERVEKELGESHRTHFLREQLRVIEEELRRREERVGETEAYARRVEESGMSEDAARKAMAELARLDRIPASSPESVVAHDYLDTLVALPWNRLTEDRLDLVSAGKLLDERHYGLAQVKDRVLDHLAVRKLRGSPGGAILCFVGPPGVGKTSIGRSIADALGRKMVRLSLGGIRDEAEIRGHRRTYVGAMPGRILQGLLECDCRNPVVVLDEIDKVGVGGQGDPTSALLEALDPEQNRRFVDRYVDTPFDLSAVMFVATANLIDNVPAPLRDRMEIIPFRSYTDEERFAIAQRHLLPAAIRAHGLPDGALEAPDQSLWELVCEYTREPGVRDLSRQIDALCRKVARRVAMGEERRLIVDSERLRNDLGLPRFAKAGRPVADQVGVAWGMAVGERGGDLVTVEVSLTGPVGQHPDLLITGNLGDVMRESALAALTYLRAHASRLAPEKSLAVDAHIHVSEGAIPKDGPSAGLTVAVALASAFSGHPVRGAFAMTGEITLRGAVLPVGGIREKILAAVRAGKTDVILPAENGSNLSDVPASALANLRIHLVEHLDEAIRLAMRKG